VTTNVDYLQRLVTHPAYVAGGFNTHFVEEHRAALNAPVPPPAPYEVLFAACAVLSARDAAPSTSASPWSNRDCFRLNHDFSETLILRADGEDHTLVLTKTRTALRVVAFDHEYAITRHAWRDDQLAMVVDGEHIRATVFSDPAGIHVLHDGRYRQFVVFDPLHAAEEDATAAGSLTAPMPGAITAVMVAAGDRVVRGAPLMMLEAMKIEHTIVAPFDGVVTEVRYAKGEQVTHEGAELIKLEPAA